MNQPKNNTDFFFNSENFLRCKDSHTKNYTDVVYFVKVSCLIKYKTR